MSTMIDGDKLADSIHTDLCDGIKCDDCPFCLEDGGCKVEEWLEGFPFIETKQIKHFDEDEKVWKIGEVIIAEQTDCPWK